MITTVEQIKSAYVIGKEKRDLQLFFRYEELISVKDAMAMTVNRTVMDEFRIHSDSTVWKVCNRVRRNLEQLISDYPEFQNEYQTWLNRQKL